MSAVASEQDGGRRGCTSSRIWYWSVDSERPGRKVVGYVRYVLGGSDVAEDDTKTAYNLQHY